MRRVLEFQADQIELVLTSHRVSGRVTGGVVTPRWVSYQVLPDITTKVSRIMALSEELALRLGAQGVRVSRQGAAVQVDVPRQESRWYLLILKATASTPSPRSTNWVEGCRTCFARRFTRYIRPFSCWVRWSKRWFVVIGKIFRNPASSSLLTKWPI
ncbi:MAG: hypothetical protein HYR94_05510 [Chloroflexi bacterium]|nr:hypothetical protein [Chloroflexota bacterium]